MFELKKLEKWDPIKELSTIHRDMDDLFKRVFGSASMFGHGLRIGAWFPTMDAFVRDGKLVVRADLPGIDPKKTEITISGGLLTIKGERKTEKTETKEGVILSESAYGAFERTMTLPDGVDTADVHATYKNGVLELTMPTKAVTLPKKVTIEIEEGKETEKAA